MFVNIEQIAAPILLAGLAIFLLGYLWLIIRGFQHNAVWGFALILPPWLPQSLVFAARHPQPTRAPFLVMFIGMALLATTSVLNFAGRYLTDRSPYEQIVDGERHLTLNGWDRTDYDVTIRTRPDVVVLQMANPDVTDETLKSLVGLKKLKELDLNQTAITDAGLATLATLPELQRLRLSQTRITDEGFRNTLMPLKQLAELDLRGTTVSSSTVREWKADRPDRKALK